jgi:hypothetical protein
VSRLAPDTGLLVSLILNAAWMVRHYARGGRSTIQRTERTQAIQKLGLTVREAFSQSEDFEPLLAAVVDGLRPKDDPPF